MEHCTLGRTGTRVSPLCLGVMMFGTWGNPDHSESVRLTTETLNAIDGLVPAGTNLNAGDAGYQPPSASTASLRRRVA
jgi:hypothetical protein